jgi:electron transfer flavoprotein alpha subunit
MFTYWLLVRMPVPQPQPQQIAGVSKVLHADAAHFADGLAENVAEQVLAVAAGYSHILAPATAYGKNILPRVAAKLDVSQISEITKVDAPDTFERPIYAGNAIATVQSTDAVKVITVRTTGFDAAQQQVVQRLLRPLLQLLILVNRFLFRVKLPSLIVLN